MSRLRDKLYQHEVPPPPGAWQKIASALDESETGSRFPQRLYEMEVPPPGAVWEQVREELNPAPVVSAPVKRIPAFAKYAAAAVVVGMAALGIYRFAFNHDEPVDSLSSTIRPNKDSNAIATKPADTSTTENNETRKAENLNQLPTRSLAVRNHQPPSPGSVPYVRQAVSFQVIEPDMELKQSIYAYTDLTPDISDRYVTLMTPDGQLIRMSKKWSELICCVSGEEQDAECVDQIKKWQEKLATSQLAPAPGNFMDILGLVNSLNEASEL